MAARDTTCCRSRTASSLLFLGWGGTREDQEWEPRPMQEAPHFRPLRTPLHLSTLRISAPLHISGPSSSQHTPCLSIPPASQHPSLSQHTSSQQPPHLSALHISAPSASHRPHHPCQSSSVITSHQDHCRKPNSTTWASGFPHSSQSNRLFLKPPILTPPWPKALAGSPPAPR